MKRRVIHSATGLGRRPAVLSFASDMPSEGLARWRRLARPIVAMALGAAVALLMGTLAGCKTAARVAPAQVTAVPEWDELKISHLLYMGTAGSAGDETARVTAEEIIEHELLAGQDRFLVLGLAESRNRAAASGAVEQFDRVARVWKNDQVADVLLVQQLCQKLGVDGIIFGSLTDWILEQVEWTSEGSSSTQVSLALSIYSGKTGQLAWRGQKTHRKESIPYRHEQASGVWKGEGGVERAERPQSTTPKPPPADEVAVEAVRAVVAAFPPKTAS